MRKRMELNKGSTESATIRKRMESNKQHQFSPRLVEPRKI